MLLPWLNVLRDVFTNRLVNEGLKGLPGITGEKSDPE